MTAESLLSVAEWLQAMSDCSGVEESPRKPVSPPNLFCIRHVVPTLNLSEEEEVYLYVILPSIVDGILYRVCAGRIL